MKTSRRSFLAFLAATPLARVLGFKGDQPFPSGETYISTREMRIPLQIKPGGDFGNIVAAELERVNAYLPKLFERDDTFFTTMHLFSNPGVNAVLTGIGMGDREEGGTRRRKGRGRSQRGRRG